MIDGESGAVGEMRIGRENLSTRRKPAPVPFCASQISHDIAWARTRAAPFLWINASWRIWKRNFAKVIFGSQNGVKSIEDSPVTGSEGP
jgi:hypothetical protein